KRIATWNRARSVWETAEQALCGHSVPFSRTWPTSGSMRSGVVYALPTWEPPTDDSGSSSSRGPLLPTPIAAPGDIRTQNVRLRVVIWAWATAAETDSGAWGYSQSICVAPGRSSGTASVEHGVGADSDSALVTLLPTPQARDWKDHQVQVAGHRPADKDSINRAIAHLLPTPRTSDTNGAGVHGTGAQDPRTVIDLLPTPRARDHIREGYEAGLRRSSPQLETTAVAGVKGDINWGEYADAIARLERV